MTMTAHPERTGKQTMGGRLFVLAGVVLTLGSLMPSVSLSATGASESVPVVTVREERGVYSVSARFHVNQPAAVVLSVLTDYEDIPRFMSQIKTSVVHERAGGHAVVEQEAVS